MFIFIVLSFLFIYSLRHNCLYFSLISMSCHSLIPVCAYASIFFIPLANWLIHTMTFPLNDLLDSTIFILNSFLFTSSANKLICPKCIVKNKLRLFIPFNVLNLIFSNSYSCFWALKYSSIRHLEKYNLTTFITSSLLSISPFVRSINGLSSLKP